MRGTYQKHTGGNRMEGVVPQGDFSLVQEPKRTKEESPSSVRMKRIF